MRLHKYAEETWSADRTGDPRITGIKLRDANPPVLESWVSQPKRRQLGSFQWSNSHSVEIERVPLWFAQALAVDSQDDPSSAIDILYDNVDRMLTEGKYEAVDAILRPSAMGEASLTFLMAILSITFPASRRLARRSAFYEHVWNVYVEKGEDAQKLLGGLKSWSRLVNYPEFPDSWS